VNGLANSFLVFKEKRQLLYPLRKTAYACVYEVVRDVFENGTMLQGTMSTPQLETPEGSINAVSARAVTRNRETAVLAVNLTDRPCRFILKLDGKIHDQSLVHEAMVFGDPAEVVVLGFDDAPLKPVQNERGMVTLPPLSVNRISGVEQISQKR
jgi:hypothetical protein